MENMKNHWKFYETEPDYDLVMVDPDSDFQHKSINIEVQSNSFKTLSQVGSDKQRGFQNGGYTVWQDFKVTNNCHNIIVAPDLDLITQAVEYAKNQCDGEINTISEVIKLEVFELEHWYESPALVYQDWLRNAIKDNKELRLGLD